jgi:hypothetical protein
MQYVCMYVCMYACVYIYIYIYNNKVKLKVAIFWHITPCSPTYEPMFQRKRNIPFTSSGLKISKVRNQCASRWVELSA